MATAVFTLDDGSEVETELDESIVEHLRSGVPGLGESLRRNVQRAEYLRRRIDTTPFEFKGYKGDPLSPAGNLPSNKRNPKEHNRRAMLAASGITVGVGPFNKTEIDYFHDLAKDSPHEFANFFMPKVKEKIAPDDDVDPSHLVKLGDDGKIRFLDLRTQANPAGTNRWTEFETSKFGPFDMLEVGLDVVGSKGGYDYAKKAGLGSFKEASAIAGGATIGTMSADLARTALGKAHGIRGPLHPDPNASPREEAEAAIGSAGRRGLLAGGASMVGSYIGQIAHNIHTRLANPYFFSRDTASNIEESLAAGQRVVDDVRSVPGAEKFNPDLATMSGEQSLLDLKNTLVSRAGGSSEAKITGIIQAADQTQNRILNNALARQLAGPEVGAERAGMAIKAQNLDEILRAAPEQQRKEIQALLAQHEADSAKLGSIQGLDDLGRGDIVRRIRGAKEITDDRGVITQHPTGLEKLVRDGRAVEFEAWDQYETLVGRLEAQSGGKPLTIRLDGTEGLTERLREFRIHADQIMQGLPIKSKFTSVLNPIEAAVEAGEMPLSAVNVNLSALKHMARIAKKEVGQESPSIPLLEATIGSLQAVRDKYILNTLRSPEIANALLKAEATTKYVHDLTSRSVASGLLAQSRQGVYRIKNPDDTFKDIMVPGTDEGARQWMDLVKDDPRLVQATKDWYGQHYHARVINPNTNIADPVKHERWMRDYGPQAKLVFGEDFAAVSRLGGIGRAIKEGEQRVRELEVLLKKSSMGKINRMDPEQVVAKILGTKSRLGGASSVASPLTQQELRTTIEVLRAKSPETLALVQDRAKEMMRMSLFGNPATKQSSRPLDSATLGKYLEESQQARLSTLFGEGYVGNLRKLRSGLEMMERSGKGKPLPIETVGLTMFRVIFGPLSRTQRFISASRRYSVVGLEQKLAEVITDPAKLRLVMSVSNLPATSPAGIAVLSQLGVLEATN